jgi:hypothetical protein
MLMLMVSRLRKLTNDLKDSPYDPELWLNRGQVLAKLGYPELVGGDNYKAILLVQAGQKVLQLVRKQAPSSA